MLENAGEVLFHSMVRMMVILFLTGLALAGAATQHRPVTLNTLESSPNIIKNESEKRVARHVHDSASLIFDVARTLLRNSVDLNSVAACVINWLVSNSLFIIIGAASAIGFCKITNMCSLHYETYLPVSEMQHYITPEYIDTAERYLRSAVEKYVES